jgi:chemotaxis protein MotD
VSAAQVLAPGLPAASSGVRPSSSGGATAERGDTSFSDTLDRASRSSEAPEGDAVRLSPDRMRERGKGNGSTADDGEADATAVVDGVPVQAEIAAVSSELSAVIAALSGTTAPTPSIDAASAGAAQRDVANIPALAASVAASLSTDAAVQEGAVEAGPWMPGQVAEATDTPDAEQLLAMLKAGATSSGTAVAEPDNVDVKASVTGRETHLALKPLQYDGAIEPTAEAATAPVPVQGDDTAAMLGAALSQAADEAAKPVRAGGSAARDVEAKLGSAAADADTATHPAVAVDELDARGGAVFADQDISGREGRQQDGRGSSGASSQQQGTGSFMSAMAGVTSTGAGAVQDAPDTGAFYEPVADQIAAGVRAELNADGMGTASSDGVVKVLNIELKPANLGSVTVRIALKDNAITVHIETQQRDTQTAIERERDALVGALAAAGYSVDSITTGQQSDAARFQGLSAGLGDAGSSASRGGSQGQASQGFSNSSGGEGRSNESGSGNSAYRPPSDDKDVSSGGVRRDAGGLYV